MNFRATAISGIKWTSVGTVGRAVFQLLQVAILTRFLPKEAFGLVAMALFVVHFSNIFVDMGMTSAILHRQNATKNEYSSIYWLNIFISLLLYGILFFGAPAIARFYEEPELLKLIPILGTNLLLMATGRQHRTIMQKQFQFQSIAIIELFAIFMGLIAAIVLAVKEYGVYSLVYSTLLASLISNVLFLMINLRLNPIWFHFSLSETKPFLKIGGFTMGSTLLDFFSHDADILIIGKMLGAEKLGVYSLAKQIVMRLFSIINPIVINVLSPLLSSIQKQKEKLKSSFLKVVKYLAYINFPVYALIIVASKEILYYMYGPEYVDAYPVLSFLAVAYCLSAIGNPVGSLQIATGRTDIGFKWTIIRVLVTPVFIFIGSIYSITAVAAFYAFLSVSLLIPLWYIQLRPMAEIQLTEYLSQFYKPLIFLFPITIVIYFWGERAIIFESLIINAVLKASITLIAFTAYLYFLDKKSIFDFFNFVLSTLNREK